MASTSLSKTYASNGNRRLWTFSTWVKRSNIGSSQFLLSSGDSTPRETTIYFYNNQLQVEYYTSGVNNYYLRTTRLFRDTSAWYHLVFIWDSENATSSDRIRIYVNGERETSFSATAYPPLNLDSYITVSFMTTYIGRYFDTPSYFDGSMAATYFIDGQALTPTSFGETDATTGIWKPKSYSGTYGTNGFFLKFENGASLGTDSSGNGNNFTVNGTPTQTLDTPSNVFATVNPLNNSGLTLSNGNLQFTGSSAAHYAAQSTFAVNKGKWYFELKDGTDASNNAVGVMNTEAITSDQLNATGGAIFYRGNGQKYINGTATSYGATFTTGDIIGVALDMDNGNITFYKNNTSQGVISSSIDTAKYWSPAVKVYSSDVASINFGNGYFGSTAISSPYSDGAGLGKFQYQPPTGYYALCTKNINVYG